MVAIENSNELAVGKLHCMIEIAGFCMVVFCANDVLDVGACGKIPESVSTSIIKQEDSNFILWPIEVFSRKHRGLND